MAEQTFSKPIKQMANTTGLPDPLFEYFNPDAKKGPQYDEAWFQGSWEYVPSPQDEVAGALGKKERYGQMVNKKTGQQMPLGMWQTMNAQKEAEKKKAEGYAKGVDEQGRPIGPEYFSMIDPTTGMLYSQYQVKPETLDASKLEGYQALKERALGTGPSKWANLMLDKQKQEELAGRDLATRQAMSGAAQARSQLAMRGGLRGGARERLASQSMRDALAARQDVSKQGIGSRFGILTEDESQRMKLLPQFSEAEGQLSRYNLELGNRAQQSNIEAALKEKQMKDAMAMDKYKEQMRAWAAEKEAEATRNQGGGGGGGK